MAVLALLLERQLGESLAYGRKEEQRIVSEAARTARGGDQLARGFTVKGGECAPVAGDRDYAYVTPRVFSRRKLCQLSAQGEIVGFVVGVRVLRRIVAGRAEHRSVPRRVNAGRTVEFVDRQPGVFS